MVVTLGSDHPSKLLDELDQLNRPCKVMLHINQKGVAAEALLGALMKNIPCIQHLHVTGPRSFFNAPAFAAGLAGSGLVSLAFDL